MVRQGGEVRASEVRGRADCNTATGESGQALTECMGVRSHFSWPVSWPVSWLGRKPMFRPPP